MHMNMSSSRFDLIDPALPLDRMFHCSQSRSRRGQEDKHLNTCGVNGILAVLLKPSSLFEFRGYITTQINIFNSSVREL
jgi:hypothetical protein